MKQFLQYLIIFALVATGVPAALAQDKTWDDLICEGSEGVVWRTVDATTSDLPQQAGCEEDEETGWLVVEPWGDDGLNPDRACYAHEWIEVVEASEENNWTNGSAWLVSSEITDNPLVVECSNVTRDGQLGLNPFESQVMLSTIRQTVRRANQLLKNAGWTMTDYVEEFDDLPITQLFLILLDEGIIEE